MSYKQIDGDKPILVNQKGQVREELRNLPDDSDRFIYEYDEKGNKKNEWPVLVVDVNENGKDERLLPELVMKMHGRLPDKMKCSKEDFKSKSGSKNKPKDSALDNLEFTGEGSSGDTPYAKPPEEKTEEAPKKAAPTARGQTTSEQITDTEAGKKPLPGTTSPTPEEKTDAKVDADSADDGGGEDEPVDKPTPDGDEELPDLAKGSGALNAKRAIEIIRNYDFEELADAEFYTEDTRDGDIRVTVKDEWEKKQKEAQK